MKYMFSYLLGKKSQWAPLMIVCYLFIVSQSGIVVHGENSDSIFDYVSCNAVNEIGKNILFKCVFSPFVNPESVTINIMFPNGNRSEFKMTERSTGKYINTTSFSDAGQYSFFVSAKVDNQLIDSVTRSFWVTSSLSDKDNDKMDDEWEHFYGFDSTDPSDAFWDFDGDGYKNLDEFILDTDPLDPNYTEFVWVYINSHFPLIVLTLFFLVITFVCSLVGLRRSTKWI